MAILLLKGLNFRKNGASLVSGWMSCSVKLATVLVSAAVFDDNFFVEDRFQCVLVPTCLFWLYAAF